MKGNGKMNKVKYITKNGTELTEEALEEIYRMHSFTTFNERAYNAWKQDKLEQGLIKVVAQRG